MFNARSKEKEFLDDLQCEGEDLKQNLKELKFINTWLGGNDVTIAAIASALKKKSWKGPLKVADIGCGGGDILSLIASWGRKKELSISLIGLDANAYIINYAKENTKTFPEITYAIQDVFSESEWTADIINCTLFCHHFDDDQLVKMFKQFKSKAKLAVVINDLHRHWFAYYSIYWLTSLFSKSYMVKNDAKLSVLRGFSKKELRSIVQASGYTDYTIRWRWAFRWEVVLYA